ncbi:CDP-glucose 4,6-dehydratase [Salegentibacter salinarum]|uniref:CDP-glucose 4,6-dehydratase n=1 Tax=Salegentibacter salinarum TaxID=447422 RepID=A0A2N0TNC2_9FLAO|nr:CDP-glucose 4,6-dehydratase [Salegentibacter salinarum]PKD16249.1 CDP-glucose 4,6-dehydratase [Salegentibacter salinarum]SKB67438.1 CDP-glucose 4,6-dehydratase [Salegentibacter salinarum]
MFESVYKNKKVLITGNTGFKGAWLSIWLHELGADVYGLSDRIPTEPSIFESLSLKDIIKHHFCDIRNLGETKKIINEIAPNFIFHLAAQPIVGLSYQNPVETIETNVLGTTNVLETFRLLQNECTGIFITSDKCYENVEWTYGYRETDPVGGKDIYSASKGACEVIIHGYYESFIKNIRHLKLASVRAGNVIGGGDWADKRLVPDCIRAWSENRKVEIRNPYSTRPWQHVLEPLSGYLRTGQKLSQNKIPNGNSFNFGPPGDHSHTVEKILEKIAHYWNPVHSEGLFEVNEEGKFHEAGLLKLNCDKALADLNWISVLSFDDTARFTAEWYKTYYERNENMMDYTKKQINEYTNKAFEKKLAWTQRK